MINEKSPIHKYIDEKKELQEHILNIFDESDDSNDASLQNLLNFLDSHQYKENKSELKHFLHLISTLSINHNRKPNFFKIIETILTISSKFFKPLFSNEELFVIFQQSKPILLFLIKSKILEIDEIIFKYLLLFNEDIENETFFYFYPELNSIIKSGAIEGINEKKYPLKMIDNIENFEKNRQKFVNDSKICSIIREDLIDDFIQYVHENSISLSGKIRRSVFETNSMFIEKDPTIIEYATFYGSIRIIKYLEINKVELTPSLWLYAVHSNNPEVISFLEDKNIELDDRTFSEVIKCHHNSISTYIYDNYLGNSDLNEKKSFEYLFIVQL